MWKEVQRKNSYRGSQSCSIYLSQVGINQLIVHIRIPLHLTCKKRICTQIRIARLLPTNRTESKPIPLFQYINCPILLQASQGHLQIHLLRIHTHLVHNQQSIVSTNVPPSNESTFNSQWSIDQLLQYNSQTSENSVVTS